MMKRIALIPLMVIGLNGCFFGMLHRPGTLGKGNWDASIYGAFQFLPNPDIRQEIQDAGYITTSSMGMDLMVGATDRIDVGFHAATDGIGPFARFAALRFYHGSIRNELTISPYLLYEPFVSQSVAARVDLTYSWKLNPYFEPYVLYQGYYNPYFDRYFENEVGASPIGNVGGGYHHFYGGGAALNLYFDRASLRRNQPDLTINMELLLTTVLLPDNRVVPVFHFGFGVSGRQALRLLFAPPGSSSRGGLIFNLIGLLVGLGHSSYAPPPPDNTETGTAPSPSSTRQDTTKSDTTKVDSNRNLKK